MSKPSAPNTRYNRSSPRRRLTGAIVASVSLLSVVFFVIPWVDEYIDLKRQAAEMDDLEVKLVNARVQHEKLERIEEKLSRELADFLGRSVDPGNTESVRETLIAMVRGSGAKLRRLEVSDGESRQWAIEGDDARNESTPLYGEPSRFILHLHAIELQADGPIESIKKLLDQIAQTGWFATTRALSLEPTASDGSLVNLELRFVVYGLSPEAESVDDSEQYALLGSPSMAR